VGGSGFTWFGISISGRSPVTTAMNLLGLGTRCRSRGNLTPKPFTLGTPLTGDTVGPTTSLDSIKRNTSCLLPGIEPQSPSTLPSYSTSWAKPAHRAERSFIPTHTKCLLPRKPLISSHTIRTFPCLCLHGGKADVSDDSPLTHIHIMSNATTCRYVSSASQFVQVISNSIMDFSNSIAATQRRESIWATSFLQTTS
jgi:hypothetical protein